MSIDNNERFQQSGKTEDLAENLGAEYTPLPADTEITMESGDGLVARLRDQYVESNEMNDKEALNAATALAARLEKAGFDIHYIREGSVLLFLENDKVHITYYERGEKTPSYVSIDLNESKVVGDTEIGSTSKALEGAKTGVFIEALERRSLHEAAMVAGYKWGGKDKRDFVNKVVALTGRKYDGSAEGNRALCRELMEKMSLVGEDKVFALISKEPVEESTEEEPSKEYSHPDQATEDALNEYAAKREETEKRLEADYASKPTVEETLSDQEIEDTEELERLSKIKEALEGEGLTEGSEASDAFETQLSKIKTYLKLVKQSFQRAETVSGQQGLSEDLIKVAKENINKANDLWSDAYKKSTDLLGAWDYIDPPKDTDKRDEVQALVDELNELSPKIGSTKAKIENL